MKDKVCMITGANNGIGEITSLELAKMGAHVIMVCRNKEKGEKARKKIIDQSGNQNVDLLLADLSSQNEIHQLVIKFNEKYEKLHVLVNNAGVYLAKRDVSDDGLEKTLATNHIAYFLLTQLLLPVLIASSPSRIVNVSSDAHRGRRINFDDLQRIKKYKGMQVYGDTKLANIYFTYELAERLQCTGVTVNCLHPGFVSSGFAKNNGLLYKIGLFILRPFQIHVNKGAETSIYLATSPEVEGITGRYFVKKKVKKSSTISYDEIARKKLWEVSEKFTFLDSK